MPQITLYAVIKLTVDVVDNTSPENVAARIASEADYKVAHEDDICEVKDTELLDVSDTCPV